MNKKYYFIIVALLDSGANSNCIQEKLISAKYYEKTPEGLSQASGTSLNIKFRLPNAHVHMDGIYNQTTFVLVKNITNKVILGNPFITLLYPIKLQDKFHKSFSDKIKRKFQNQRFQDSLD